MALEPQVPVSCSKLRKWLNINSELSNCITKLFMNELRRADFGVLVFSLFGTETSLDGAASLKTLLFDECLLFLLCCSFPAFCLDCVFAGSVVVPFVLTQRGRRDAPASEDCSAAGSCGAFRRQQRYQSTSSSKTAFHISKDHILLHQFRVYSNGISMLHVK